MKRLYVGVGMVTLATLLLELLLTRIFSVTLYYHFAFMVISIALFGLGLSGVALFLRAEKHPREQLVPQLALYCRRFALSTLVALVYVVNHSLTATLDPLRVQAFTWQNFFQLSFLYLICAIPFYFGGMIVSLALHHLHERAATVYFFDLVGASLACLLLDPLLRVLGAPNAVLLAIVLVAGASLLFGEEEARWRPSRGSWGLAAFAVALLLVNLFVGAIRVGSFKWVDNQYLAFSKWNAISRIEVQERPRQRPDMTIDGQARTLLVDPKIPDITQPEDGITALVHAVRSNGRMLIIGPGGGIDVATALRAGHQEIHLAEINPTILYDVMLGKYRKRTGNLFGRKEVHPHLAEGRHYVRTTKHRFDVIQATLVDTWAATASGAFALTENHLYTVEAFEDYLARLKPDGFVAMSRWVGVPGMEFVRLAALARTALTRLGVKDPRRHTFAAFYGPLATLLVKRSPLTDDEITKLKARCKKHRFGTLYVPGEKANNPVWHVLGSKDPRGFYKRFQVDVRPVYDDRPFFFLSIKPERIIKDLLRWRDTGINSFSLQVVLAMLVLVTLLILGAIIVPMWLRQRRQLRDATRSKMRDLGYFMCLGVGFILIEIALLQRFTLLLGHPITSLRVVFFSMLFFSGVGSLVSGRVQQPRSLVRLLVGAAGGTVIISAIYAAFLGGLTQAAVGWSEAARVSLSLSLVAAPAFLMGMLLPTGLRLVATRHVEIIPWAWGINGAASVLGSVAAMFVAIIFGFSMVLILGSAMYLVALLLGLRRAGAPNVGSGDADKSTGTVGS